MLSFICKDCGNGIHDTCKKQHCECQHRTDRKNLNATE